MSGRVKKALRELQQPPPDTTPKLPEAYYDSAKKVYWIQDARETWIEVSESSVKRLFRSHGVSAAVPKGNALVPLDSALLEVQLERNVNYAASLAGHAKGIYEITGKRVLVVDSPVLVEGKAGLWSTLATVLEGLLGDEHHDQTTYLSLGSNSRWKASTRASGALVKP